MYVGLTNVSLILWTPNDAQLERQEILSFSSNYENVGGSSKRKRKLYVIYNNVFFERLEF